MRTSKSGIEFIKSYEGFSDKACKCVSTEKYYTIGYGHYGADVKADDTITKEEALKLLEKDIAKFEPAVNNLNLDLTQDAFDALVSFTYNCGKGNLTKLCKDRTISEIVENIVKYNKSGGKVLAGLTRRRLAEQAMLKKEIATYYPKCNSRETSIVMGLKSIGVNSTYSNRKKIAKANGFLTYSGLGSENTFLLSLLKKGMLIKP